jgi:F5/8 type C domain
VTEPEARPNRKQEPGAPASLGARIVEWFWRGRALAQCRESAARLGEPDRVLVQRAKVSADIAGIARIPAEPLEVSTEGIACELYRQSAYWASAALAFAGPGEAAAPSELESVSARLDESLVRQATGGSRERFERLQSALVRGSFIYFADLQPAEQTALCLELRGLSEALLEKLDERGRAVNQIRAQRLWRLGLVLALVLGIITGSVWLREIQEQQSDLTLGNPWRASSQFETGGCTTPEQECSENGGYFFHTAEERNPWVEFDLASEHPISAVQVDNRRDCCTDRAVPLVVEVSRDRKTWQLVARRDDVFSTWRARFPTVTARWVRLRVFNQTTYLHLARVRIFS